jgi:hypothetical protein
MKRMLITAATSSVLAIAMPGVAIAAHSGQRHHRHHHARRAHHARVMVFGTTTTPAATTPSTPASGTPQTPSTPAGGETAGTVASFTNGVLTITLTDGSTVSGKVTEQTEIHCQSATAGEQGEDQGDDNGNDESSSTTTARTSSHDGQGGESGQDSGGDHQGNEGQQSCTSAALVPGAVVREAELSVGSGGSIWHQIDLIQ